MPDGFQAEPPRWSSDEPRAYERYSEVNFRKPEKQAAGVPWAIIAVAAAFISVGLIAALVFGLFLYGGKSASSTFMAVAAPSTAPVRVIKLPDEVKEIQGTWIATALTINGQEAANDDVAKVKLTMDAEGFRMVLPTTQRKGDWVTKLDRLKEIDFRINGEVDMRAICEINGDTLTMCLSQDGGPRPTDFTAKKDSKHILLFLKREEP
jgi:uncharacterized protein (TIGR03067 family)